MPIVLNEFEKIGIYDDIVKAGHKNQEGITFRKSNAQGGDVLAQLKMSFIPKRCSEIQFCRHSSWTAKRSRNPAGPLHPAENI